MRSLLQPNFYHSNGFTTVEQRSEDKGGRKLFSIYFHVISSTEPRPEIIEAIFQ